jgi:SWI/SNF-related matrix-associated actin-dependent regulator of chromatin subfamily A member 5
MAPSRYRASGNDTDTSMADASEPVKQLQVDPMVSLLNQEVVGSAHIAGAVLLILHGWTSLTLNVKDVDETPDFTEDSDTNPNTTASSVVGEPLHTDGRKRRSEATQLRRSVFGKKHDRLGQSQVS